MKGNQKKEFNYIECPNRKLGLQGDFDNQYSCLLTGGPDADHGGFGYDLCKFSGKNYNRCSVMIRSKSKNIEQKVA